MSKKKYSGEETKELVSDEIILDDSTEKAEAPTNKSKCKVLSYKGGIVVFEKDGIVYQSNSIEYDGVAGFVEF